MMAWTACRRATLLVPSGPIADPDRKHLHIVLNDPFDNGHGDEVLLACVCSIPSTNIYDPICTLFPGEHSFVTKHSFVAYRFTRLMDPAVLEAKVAAGEFVAKPLMDEKIFQNVIEGLADSPQTALRFKRFLEAAIGE